MCILISLCLGIRLSYLCVRHLWSTKQVLYLLLLYWSSIQQFPGNKSQDISPSAASVSHYHLPQRARGKIRVSLLLCSSQQKCDRDVRKRGRRRWSCRMRDMPLRVHLLVHTCGGAAIIQHSSITGLLSRIHLCFLTGSCPRSLFAWWVMISDCAQWKAQIHS